MPGHGLRGSPKASYPVGWSSSELIRGPFEALSQLPHDGPSSVKSGDVPMFSHIVFLFLLGVGSPFGIYLLPYFILACIRCPSSTCRVSLYIHWHLSHQSNPGIVGDSLIKLQSTALSGAGSYLEG